MDNVVHKIDDKMNRLGGIKHKVVGHKALQQALVGAYKEAGHKALDQALVGAYKVVSSKAF